MGCSSKLIRRVIVLVAVVFTPGVGARGGMVIDSFTDVGDPNPWPVSMTSPGVIGVPEAGLFDVLGGSRLTTVSGLSFELPGLDEVRVNIGPQLGLFDYRSSVGADGEARIDYFGPFVADFSGDAFIQIDFAGFDLGSTVAMPVRVILGDGGANASLTQALTGVGAQSLAFQFSDFNNIGAIDLSSVDAISFVFNPGPGGDFRLSEIRSVVPEPATLLLLFIGGGAVARRRLPRKG